MSDVGPPDGCPICRKPVSDRYRPFCSKRCADVDLHRWLSGIYAVPDDAPPDELDAEAAGHDPDA